MTNNLIIKNLARIWQTIDVIDTAERKRDAQRQVLQHQTSLATLAVFKAFQCLKQKKVKTNWFLLGMDLKGDCHCRDACWPMFIVKLTCFVYVTWFYTPSFDQQEFQILVCPEIILSKHLPSISWFSSGLACERGRFWSHVLTSWFRSLDASSKKEPRTNWHSKMTKTVKTWDGRS